MKLLKELVTIRTGYSFRSSIDSFPAGSIEVIQAKDLNDSFATSHRPKITFPGEPSHLLKPNDILVSARGQAKAIFIQHPLKAVASSSLFVLTPKTAAVSPRFLTMFFNSPKGVKAIAELSSGASVQSITKENLGRILVPELPPDKQQDLGKVVQTIDDELALIQAKAAHLSELKSFIISKTLKEYTP